MTTQSQSTQSNISQLEQALAYSERVLGERQSALAAFEQQQSSLPTLSSIRELRAQAAAATDPAVKESLTNQANTLQNQRDTYNTERERLLREVTISADAVQQNQRLLSQAQAKAQANPASGDSGPGVVTPGQDTAATQTAVTSTPRPTVPVNSQNSTVVGDPLLTPPGADPDEGTRQGLEEPEDIDESLGLPPGADPDEGTQAGLEEPPLIDELTVPPGADQEEEGRQPGLEEPPENVDAGTKEARNSGNNNNPQPVGVQGVKSAPDWRFRISLGTSANYLYKAQNPGILKPLAGTNGVIFPYTPVVNVTYNAAYETSDVPHSNFKIYNYRSSSVESISVTGDFTAQDTFEANYVLAVIHFFRSVTKMFYGQDTDPARGLPPPLVYLSGHGDYAFDNHPAVVQSFQLNYPNDVDYINATIDDKGQDSLGGTLSLPVYSVPSVATPTPLQRLAGKLAPGGYAPSPAGRGPGTPPSKFSQDTVTRVPTKMQITLTLLPVVTRANYSNRFSLKDYATGKLLRGPTTLGGIW